MAVGSTSERRKLFFWTEQFSEANKNFLGENFLGWPFSGEKTVEIFLSKFLNFFLSHPKFIKKMSEVSEGVKQLG